MSSRKSPNTLLHYSSAAEDLRRNRQQWEAYESCGHCVVLAGPGSGKTKTLTIKLARMLAEDVRPPRGVACITYNNQCVKELKKRLGMLGIEGSTRAFIGTVHSFCLREVVIPYAKLAGVTVPEPMTVASVGEQDRLFAAAVKAVHGEGENPARYRASCTDIRRTVLERSSPDWTEDGTYAPIIEEYEQQLADAGKIDFDGMVLIGSELIKEHEWVRKALKAKYPVLVVDEYQDLGVPLHQIVLSLCFGAGMRLFAVGDPDQSIYGFNGARPALLGNLCDQPGVETIRLRMNYRCGTSIISASTAALQDSRDFESAQGHEGVVLDHECQGGFQEQVSLAIDTLVPEALARRKGRSLGDIGLLYYNQSQGGLIAKAAETVGISYVRFDAGNPYPRTPLTTWLEDCASWCAGGWQRGEPKLSVLVNNWLRSNPSADTDSMRRMLRKKLVRFLFANRDPDTTLRRWLNKSGECGLWDAMKTDTTMADELEVLKELWDGTAEESFLAGYTVATFGGQRGSPDRLNLTTIHSAKGLEYDVVIIFGLEEGRFPYTYRVTAQDIAESRRKFYVALTRAKHEAHLLWSGWYECNGGRFSEGRSRFVDDVLVRLNSDQ